MTPFRNYYKSFIFLSSPSFLDKTFCIFFPVGPANSLLVSFNKFTAFKMSSSVLADVKAITESRLMFPDLDSSSEAPVLIFYSRGDRQNQML